MLEVDLKWTVSSILSIKHVSSREAYKLRTIHLIPSRSLPTAYEDMIMFILYVRPTFGGGGTEPIWMEKTRRKHTANITLGHADLDRQASSGLTSL